jgi:hypothetical protein
LPNILKDYLIFQYWIVIYNSGYLE